MTKYSVSDFEVFSLNTLAKETLYIMSVKLIRNSKCHVTKFVLAR